jgi:hypothetical protein
MEMVEALASGQETAREPLLGAIQQPGSNPVLLKNLLEGYLPDLKLERTPVAALFVKEPCFWAD